jgi:hypothetical protein
MTIVPPPSHSMVIRTQTRSLKPRAFPNHYVYAVQLSSEENRGGPGRFSSVSRHSNTTRQILYHVCQLSRCIACVMRCSRMNRRVM